MEALYKCVTVTGSSSVSKAAQSHLLENWRDFDATKLSPAQMEVCVCFQKVVCFA